MNTWTHKLPTVRGWYWFRDGKETGLAYVDASLREAHMVVHDDDILDSFTTYSTAEWAVHETENAKWEWYGPLTPPR